MDRAARLAFALTVLATAVVPLPADEFTESLETWRAERVTRLTAPDGWLSLIGLHWLQPGENTVGSAEDASIRLGTGPAYLGTVELTTAGEVLFTAAPGAMASVARGTLRNAKTETFELNYKEGRPSVVSAHSLSFFVIQRGDKLGLRVRDAESDRRRNFVGIDYFKADPSWRIEAQWVAFPTPREIPITNILGQSSPAKVPGKAVFTRDGQTFELLPVAESADEELFFIIGDATSGEETYGAARFVYAAPPRDGKVILDFNRALNPPCAFTPFATCPLPPKENRLPIRVTAGEKNYRGQHD
ncbi:MAG: DUF1684 domain-containing protein [Candidatus Didemnitutus sp.]|nr:DUF1684 domain-containing protein [Candidatus Didemnitutus sp.]